MAQDAAETTEVVVRGSAGGSFCNSPLNRRALEVLYPAGKFENEDEAEVDIIAVHGLGSSAEWAWVWEGDGDVRVNWLKDKEMLPRVVPKSRILVYSYESKWLQNAPQTRLQLCGEDLITSIHIFRQGSSRRRPIIFVGHSFGGNVIQNAILYANSRNEFNYLPNLTVGLIFLGSPFRGSHMQRVAYYIAKIYSFSDSNVGILTDLAYDNQSLTDNLHKMVHLCKNLSIPMACFFELYRTDFARKAGLPISISSTIVTEASACLPGFPKFGLAANHLQLNKFAGPDSESFVKVSERIRQMHAGARALLRQRKNASRKTEYLLPFERNRDFVGREEIMGRVLSKILPNVDEDYCQRTVIEGLGGIGKTQIALEAAFRVKKLDPHCFIFWVPVLDVSSFENAYRTIGKMLQVGGLDEEGADVKRLVQKALSDEECGNWLLILDNADDTELGFGEAALFDFLPSSPNGSILVTTRNGEVTTDLEVHEENIIHLDKMDAEDALRLLRTRLQDWQVTHIEHTTELLELLAYIPLAIKQAAAYISKTMISTEDYLQLCRESDENTIKLLSRDFEDRGRYKQTKNAVATTWLISFQHISRQNRQAKDCLELMCFLAEKDIPWWILPLSNDLEEVEAIGILNAYGFISTREDGSSYDIHRLVRLTMRNWLKEKNEWKICLARTYNHLAFVLPDIHSEDGLYNSLGSLGIWRRFLPHIFAALELYSEIERSEIDVTRSTMKLRTCAAESLICLGKYQEAGTMVGSMLQHSQREDTPESVKCARVAARVLSRQGKYSAATEAFRAVLAREKKWHGYKHRRTISCVYELAMSMRNMEDYENSEQILRYALEEEFDLGSVETDHLKLDLTHLLAIVLESRGNLKEAELIFRQLYEVVESIPHYDTHVWSVLEGLGGTLCNQGELQEAEDLYRRAVQNSQMMNGNEHPSTLVMMNNLAWVLIRRGSWRMKEAETILRHVLRLELRVLGREHPYFVSALSNLQNIWRTDGRSTQEVEKLRTEVLSAS